MKKLTFVSITLSALLVAATVCSFLTGDRILHAGPVWLVAALGGVLAGTVFLWSWVLRERFRRRAMFALKSLLFSAGWILLFGLLSASRPVPAPRNAPDDPDIRLLQGMRDLEGRLAATGDSAGASQIRAQRQAVEARLVEKQFSGAQSTWWLLLALAGSAALAGLLAGDDRAIRRLSFGRKSPALKRREEADDNFRTALDLIAKKKGEEAVDLLAKLDPQQISPSLLSDAVLFHACAVTIQNLTEDHVKTLERMQQNDPECLELAYLLGYAYLAVSKPEQALPLLEQVYAHDPTYLQVKRYYAQAVQSGADALRRKGDFAAAEPLYKTLESLDVDRGEAKPGADNEALMAAARAAATTPDLAVSQFENIERDANSRTPADLELATLAKAGRAIVDVIRNEPAKAGEAFGEAVTTLSGIWKISLPGPCPEAKLEKELEKEKDGDGPAKPPEDRTTQRRRSVLRDLCFLEAVARLNIWRADLKGDSQRHLASVLTALRRSIDLDARFADALALYGLLLYFRGSRRETAKSYLISAQQEGFRSEALGAILQSLELLIKTKAETVTKLMEQVERYFANPEIPKPIKEKLLRDEELRVGWKEKVALERVPEVEPSVAKVVDRTARLADELEEILKEWEKNGERPEKMAPLKQALEGVTGARKRWVDERKTLEEQEAKLMRVAGLFTMDDRL